MKEKFQFEINRQIDKLAIEFYKSDKLPGMIPTSEEYIEILDDLNISNKYCNKFLPIIKLKGVYSVWNFMRKKLKEWTKLKELYKDFIANVKKYNKNSKTDNKEQKSIKKINRKHLKEIEKKYHFWCAKENISKGDCFAKKPLNKFNEVYDMDSFTKDLLDKKNLQKFYDIAKDYWDSLVSSDGEKKYE